MTVDSGEELASMTQVSLNKSIAARGRTGNVVISSQAAANRPRRQIIAEGPPRQLTVAEMLAKRWPDAIWDVTPFGPMERWPAELITAAGLVSDSAAPSCLFWGPGAAMLYNEAYVSLFGEELASPGMTIASLSGPDWKRLAYAVSAAHDGEAQAVDRLLCDSSQTRLLRSTLTPLRSARGSVSGVVELVLSQVEQRPPDMPAREPSQGLRNSEERLLSAAEIGRMGLWEWDLRSDVVHWSDHHFDTAGGGTGERTSSYRAWADRVHPDDRAAAEHAVALARTNRKDFDHEFRVVHPDGTVRWLHGRGRFFYEEDEAVRMLGAITDVTERHAWQERHRALVAELQHRVRNMLTVVRSVFSRSVETSGSLEETARHFTGRLDALARTQVQVAQSVDGSVDLENLIRDEILSVGADDPAKVKIAGPDVLLSPSVAETIGLAIHELTTNSLKYGALKMPEASLDISWSLHMDDCDTQILDFTWIERGVPTVSARPIKRGFGSELLEDALPFRFGAHTVLEMLGGGIRCEISLPLNGLVAGG